MGKRKRPSHQALSQEEIWDDSALIRSWDEAVAEYEFYHSIVARGEDVEEVLRQAELEEEGGGMTRSAHDLNVVGDSGEMPRNGTDEVEHEALEDGEVDDEGDASLRRSHREAESGVRSSSRKAATTFTSKRETTTETTELAGPGHDQLLENIKMAYWWAGYYSGLYEGQQHAKRTSPI